MAKDFETRQDTWTYYDRDYDHEKPNEKYFNEPVVVTDEDLQNYKDDIHGGTEGVTEPDVLDMHSEFNRTGRGTEQFVDTVNTGKDWQRVDLKAAFESAGDLGDNGDEPQATDYSPEDKAAFESAGDLGDESATDGGADFGGGGDGGGDGGE